MKTIGIGIVGTGKMGRAHSQAWATVPKFFDLETTPALRVACGRDDDKATTFAKRFGWDSVETGWRELVKRDDVDLVDICTSNDLHAEIALEAIRHGKHVVCEKPLAVDAPTATTMAEAAEAAGVKHMVVFNYRFVPAVRLARQLIEAGELGEIYQFVGSFQQDWLSDPNAAMTWRLRKGSAGSGVLGDLGAHIVDLARFLVGEIASITGALHTVVPTRQNERGEMERVTVDDAFESLIEFTSGASGILQASRVATGQKTRNRFEIYGSKGGLQFDFQAMNELRFLSTDDPVAVRGYRTISTTLPGAHPYADRWWGAGHLIGFEHTFTHLANEMLLSFDEHRQPTPSFRDGEACQVVLDAIAQSSTTGSRMKIPATGLNRQPG
jgi:predicted dehydrogenase